MPNAHRFALSALLVIGSAALAGLVAVTATPRYAGARIPSAADLPWPARLPAAEHRPPFVMLYVASGCVHCSRAAVLLDSVITFGQRRGFIVTSDDRVAAGSYRTKLRLHRQLVLDPDSALMRALGTRAVPTLVVFHADGSRQLLVGFTDDAPYRRALAGSER